jgi:hypothetical protein
MPTDPLEPQQAIPGATPPGAPKQPPPAPDATILYGDEKDTGSTQPSKTAPSKQPWSVGGFAENVMGQLHEMAKGLVNILPTAATASAKLYKYANDPFQGTDVGQELLNSVWDTTKQVGSGIAGPDSDYAKTWEKYKDRPVAERLAAIGYEKPLTPILDAMTLLSLGSGAIGRTGKLVGGVSRAGLAAEDVAKLGQMSTADRLATLGDQIAGIPGKIGKAVTEAPLRAVGINPESLKALRTYEGEAKAWGNQAKYDQGQRFNDVFKGFSQADKEALDKMAMEGTSAAELAANPRAAKALDEWKSFLAQREATLGENGRALLEPETMNDVIAKKYAKRMYGDITDQTLESARNAIKAMPEEFRPVYTPAIGEKAEHSILDLLLGKEEVIPPGSGTGFLKPYKGAAERISDPTVYMRKGAQQFLDLESRLKFLDNVVRDPKLTRLAQAGDKPIADLMPEGFYRKYLSDRVRAQGKGLAELATAAPAATVQEVQANLSKYLSDPVVTKYVEGLKGVAAQNNTVGKYMKYAFMRQPEELSNFIKVYDKVMGLFKLTGTVASPRWHVANVVGDAVLSTMAGEYGLNWGLMRKAVSSMPPYLREGGKYVSMEIGNWEQRYLTKLSDVTQAADDLARRGIWTNQVAARFKQAAASFASGEQTLEEFTKAVGKAHTELPTLQSSIQQIDEQIVRSSKRLRTMDAEIDGLKKELAAEMDRNTVVGGRVGPADPAKRAEIASKIDALYEARQNMVADRRAKLIQSGQLEQSLPQIQKYAEVSRQAIDRGNMFLGDYLSLGPVERSVFRRVVPFYAWTKAMAKLTFTLPFVAPKTTLFWHRWSMALTSMAGDRNLPDYMATYAPVGSTMVNGKPALIWVDVTTVSHFGKYFQTRVGDMPIPKLLAFWRENPIIQTGYRLVGGRDEFYWAGRPQDGQVWVSAGDGTVKRFRPDGKIETVVPQAPVIKTLAHMFPAVQMEDQLTTPYDINKGPAMNPDGTYRFPKELWQRIVELFGPKTRVQSREEIIQNEQRNVQHTLRELQHMYQRASPDEREYIRGVFEDYQKGMFRRMKTGS